MVVAGGIELRALVYELTTTTGRIPLIADLTHVLGASVSTVRTLLRQLARDHVLVLQPGSDEILMAMPFSAVPTTFEVETERFTIEARGPGEVGDIEADVTHLEPCGGGGGHETPLVSCSDVTIKVRVRW